MNYNFHLTDIFLFGWTILVTPLLVYILLFYRGDGVVSLESGGFSRLAVKSDTGSAPSSVVYTVPSSYVKVKTASNAHITSRDGTGKGIWLAVLPQATMTDSGLLIQDIGSDVTAVPIDSLLQLQLRKASRVIDIDSLRRPLEFEDTQVVTSGIVDSLLDEHNLTHIKVGIYDVLDVSPISTSDTSDIDIKGEIPKPYKRGEYVLSSKGYKYTSRYDRIDIDSDRIDIGVNTHQTFRSVADSVEKVPRSTASIRPYGPIQLLGNYLKINEAPIKWKLLNLDRPFVLLTMGNIEAKLESKNDMDIDIINKRPQMKWDVSRDSVTYMNVVGWENLITITRENSDILLRGRRKQLLNTDVLRIDDRNKTYKSVFSNEDDRNRNSLQYSKIDDEKYGVTDGLRFSGVYNHVSINGTSLLQTYSERYGLGPCLTIILVIGLGPGLYVFRAYYEYNSP